MPNNRSQAEHCTRQLKRRLIKNPQLQEDYKAFVEEIFQVFNVVSEISLFRNISFIQCGDGKPRLSLCMATSVGIKRPWTTVEEVAPWISVTVVLAMSQMKYSIFVSSTGFRSRPGYNTR